MAGVKRALCVGINKYKNFPSAELQGCVNDVMDMEAILTKYWGLAKEDIVKLINEDATKSDIMKNLKEMVNGAKAGKYTKLFFTLSSHGTQVPDIDGDEPDRADEAFCPHDLAQKEDAWDPAHVITDDELHDLFVQLPENVELEAFFDTCHSGDGLRAIDFLMTRKPRYLPPPSLKAFEKIEDRRKRGVGRLFLERGLTSHILWSACRPDQTSADAKIGPSWHGAFTYYIVKNIDESQNKLTRPELLAKVRDDLDKGRYSQVPQLDLEATKRKTTVS
jgi:metacaspase-1